MRGAPFLPCDDLLDGNYVGDATEYVADGTTTPPDSDDYRDPFVRPATIAVHESHPLHGVRYGRTSSTSRI